MSVELDAATASALMVAGAAHVRSGCRVLVLDLANLSFMDSSGLGALVHIRNQAIQAKVGLVLQRPRHNVLRVLQVTGMADVFTVDSGDVAQTG